MSRTTLIWLIILGFAQASWGFWEDPGHNLEDIMNKKTLEEKVKEEEEAKGREKRETLTTDEANNILSKLQVLARQAMLQDFGAQEQVRSEGSSGIKQNRLFEQGSATYHATSFTGKRFASIHDHNNNRWTIGIGELAVVLNGVNHRTRHNDFVLSMPSPTSTDYHETLPISFPDVPPEVLSKSTVPEQIAEMKEFFKAFANEDPTHRDYTPYFKPLLCYLEGAWTISDSDKIDESFESDRHHLDAKSWFDLQEKVRFTAATGTKDPLENYAYLPTTIISTNGTLKLAQWNYRILCHPLNYDLKPSRLVLVEDMQSLMWYKMNGTEIRDTRAARFKVAPKDEDSYTDKVYLFDLLDTLMGEVPGKDNYPGHLTDDAQGSLALHYETSEPLNAAYYHRWFKKATKDAMGETREHRGYADPTGFMAMTSQPNIAPMSMTKCEKDSSDCVTIEQRWTYAIPLEIVYLTPLLEWNPYNIEYKGKLGNESDAQTVEADGRDGSSEKPFNGTHLKKYYRTPAEFYKAPGSEDDSADTGKGEYYVLDRDNTAHLVVASGTKIIVDEIEDVGRIRLRYPIAPVYQGDSAAWKELDALTDIVLSPSSQHRMFYEQFPTGEPEFIEWKPPAGAAPQESITYLMGTSNPESGSHTHQVEMTLTDMQALQAPGASLSKTTGVTDGHSHTLEVIRNNWGGFKYSQCDNSAKCADEHAKKFTLAN